MQPRMVLLVILGVLIVACTRGRPSEPVITVTPVAGEITRLCIEPNDAVLMDGFLPELRSQIAARGVAAEIAGAGAAPDCSHRMVYTANWRWDLAVYLYRAEFTVLAGERQVGHGLYDATEVGGTGKFGATAEKIAPLIARLFPV